MTKRREQQGVEPQAEPAAGEGSPERALSSSSRFERFGTFAVVLALSGAFLIASIGRSGVWDPHELDRADLARRLAVLLFDAADLRLEGAPDTMPTLGDLGMGELPFTSMAWGLSTFGLADHAGRLPLALWALVGALTLYLLLARLVSPRAGLYGVIVLVTMPLYFMQARTMLGDIVTMAAHMACFAGLLGALLDDRAATARRRAAVTTAWLIVGLGGGLAGYLSRGAIIGLAAPVLAVGLDQPAPPERFAQPGAVEVRPVVPERHVDRSAGDDQEVVSEQGGEQGEGGDARTATHARPPRLLHAGDESTTSARR